MRACAQKLNTIAVDQVKPFIKYSSSVYFDNLWICNHIFVKVSEIRIISCVTQRVGVRGLNLLRLADRLGCHYMNLLPGYFTLLGNFSFRSLGDKFNCLFDTPGRYLLSSSFTRQYIRTSLQWCKLDICFASLNLLENSTKFCCPGEYLNCN